MNNNLHHPYYFFKKKKIPFVKKSPDSVGTLWICPYQLQLKPPSLSIRHILLTKKAKTHPSPKNDRLLTQKEIMCKPTFGMIMLLKSKTSTRFQERRCS